MASQVDVCNRALTKLGAARITALTDNSKSARVMSSLWETVRRSELRKRNWGFAMSRDSLPASATAPRWGFANAFPLPSDYLRLAQVNDTFVVPSLSDYRQEDDSGWAIERVGGVLCVCCDFDAPLKIRYVVDVTDPGAFDALFVEALASKLAYEACYEVTQSNQGREAMAADYKAAISDAARNNAIERAPTGLPDDSWMLGRL
jgi:hypothetical protein